MFFHLQMSEYFRLNIEYLRSASGGSILQRSIKKMTERHAAPALRERLPQIFNFQYSIVNSGLSGFGIDHIKNYWRKHHGRNGSVIDPPQRAKLHR